MLSAAWDILKVDHQVDLSNQFIIYSFIFCCFIPLGVVEGAGAYLSIIGQRRGTPWTSRQFITGLTYRDEQPFTLTFTSTGNLESPINLPPAYMFLDCGRNSENPG